MRKPARFLASGLLQTFHNMAHALAAAAFSDQQSIGRIHDDQVDAGVDGLARIGERAGFFADQDLPVLERWAGMADAETAQSACPGTGPGEVPTLTKDPS